MKKICLTILLLLPALLSNAQGIKAWNDMLDDFIDVFNKVNPTLDSLYENNGVVTAGFTYFDPVTENVVMEAEVIDPSAFGNVTDDVMNQAKDTVVNHLAKATKSSQRINSVVNEFEKRNTDVVLLYSANQNGNKVTKQVTITPSEIKAAR